MNMPYSRDQFTPFRPRPSFDERPLVYVAGPYTNPDPVENTHRTIKYATQLQATGKVTCVVPHLNLMWHAITPKEYTYWLDYDLALLKRCDLLLRLPGESTGADDEVKYAREHDIPVFFSEEALLSYLDRMGQ